MENEEMALNQTNGEATVVNSTPEVEEQTAENTPIESTEPASEGETNEVETDQREPKKGAEKRIRELNGEVKSLRQKLTEATGGNGAIPTQQYQPRIDLDSEVTPEQYRQHVMQEASTLVDLKLKQSETLNRIDNESQQVMKEYPQLDPSSDKFDKELSETISDAIEAQVKLNPYSTSVKKIADKLMKPYSRSVSNAVEQEKETITRQVSQSALRPTNVRNQEKPFAEKSIQEMEAELGIMQS